MFHFFTPENIKNRRFSDVFRSYRSVTLVENGLRIPGGNELFKVNSEGSNRSVSTTLPDI